VLQNVINLCRKEATDSSQSAVTCIKAVQEPKRLVY